MNDHHNYNDFHHFFANVIINQIIPPEEFLYVFHTGIEALFGSLLVIRGRGSMDSVQV